jgi:NAD(P)-dependent dehydrogenase (short-subunit alcohol dehydrogenase family)
MSHMEGKVILITGATNGIGEVTARELARMGAEVVIVGRSHERCLATIERIQKQTGRSNVSCIVADLSKMQDVRYVAQEFLAKHDKLHVLINNAGAMYAQRHITEDGYEMMLALNHLSYFLLTNLLLDVLKKTAEQDSEARIVNVSSEAHRFAKKIDFDDLQREKRFNLGIYNETKLMNIMFTYDLVERLRGTKVTANCLHPGLVRSNFGKNNNAIVAAFWYLSQLFAGISVEEGAKTSIYLASSPEVRGLSGRYFELQKERRTSDISYNIVARRRLWQVSELLTELTPAAPPVA